MADYQRILSYLYRYEKAEKKECFGFVKAEQKSGSLKPVSYTTSPSPRD